MIAYALNPHLPESDQAYPFLVTTLVPLGLRGLIIAALMAAIMSTFNSLLNSSATILTLDIYKRHIKPAATDREMVRFGQLCGICILFVGTAWAPMVAKFGSIFSFFQEGWVLFAAPIVAVFILGLLWRKATPAAAFWTLLLCFPVFALVYIRRAIEWNINPFNLGGIVLIFSFLFMTVISLASASSDYPTESSSIWDASLLKLPKEETSTKKGILKQFVFWWAVMVVIYICIYIVYW